jgi:Domain of unknown function (DUF1996)
MMRTATLPKLILLLMALMIALFIASLGFAANPADANSRIRAGSCDVYAINYVDPIALGSGHRHAQFMNPTTTDSSTGESLKAANMTTCSSPNSQWATSAGWFPDAQDFDPLTVAIYYRDPGDLTVKPIPTGLKMLTTSENVTNFGQNSTIRFPNCVAVDSSGDPVLDSVDHKSHLFNAGTKACPPSHPYRIPQFAYLIHWQGNLTASTLVSTGTDTWGAAGENFHADYFGAVQDEFNFPTSKGKALIDLCLNDVPLSVAVADPRCGPEP